MPVTLLGAVLVAGFLLGACAGGNGNSSIGGPPHASSPRASAPKPAAGGGCPASAGLTSSVALHGARTATGSAETLAAGNFFFEPTCLTAIPVGVVQLTISNTGAALHNFSLPGQGIDQDVEPGKHITVSVRVATLALQYVCKYHRTSGTMGALLPGPPGGP